MQGAQLECLPEEEVVQLADYVASLVVDKVWAKVSDFKLPEEQYDKEVSRVIEKMKSLLAVDNRQ